MGSGVAAATSANDQGPKTLANAHLATYVRYGSGKFWRLS